jgi:signal transduction histidine kinase
MVQILLNLAINALDAMPGGGALTFQVSAEDGLVSVRVRDTGGGVPAGVIAHIFEPFYTTKAPGRGTGLGLFVTKGLVEAIGGVIDVEQTGPDGSVFRLRLPAATWKARAAQ